jgi:hypothetical protein
MNEYQKRTKPTGNQGEPFSDRTTRQAEMQIAELTAIHKTSPPMPISTTSVPYPLSTPPTGGFTRKKRATYCPPSAVVPTP